MDLKSMLLPEKVVTFDYPGCDGFSVDLVFLSKETQQDLIKKSTNTKFNPRTRKPEETFDDELFLQLYVKAIIRGWKGLKLKHLNELVLADIGSQDPEAELDYSEENAIELMKASQAFDNWVSDMIGDLGNFTKSSTIKKSEKSKPTLQKVATD